jgi:multiple sugar transport system permease protein
MARFRTETVRPAPTAFPGAIASMPALRTRPLGQRIGRARWAYAFIFPAFLAVVLFQVWPSLQALYLSFFDARLRTREFIGLDNYHRFFFDDPLAWTSLKNTLVYVAGMVPVTVVLSLTVAVLLSSFSPRIQSFFRGSFYLPVVAGTVILSIVWRWIFNPTYGILPFVLEGLGIDPPIFLGDPSWAIWAIVAVSVTSSVGATILIYMASLAAIPSELNDAARIDGAGPWALFRHITAPLLRPTTLFVVVVSTIGALQIWDLIYLMTLGGPEYSTFTLGFMVFTEAFTYSHYGYASAIAIVLLLLVLGVAIVELRLLRQQT